MAEAQIIAGPGLGKAPDSQEGKPGLPPPPSLPGAQDSGGVAPSEKTPSDMPPTDALFDAIDRGDIVAARDAIKRGAELGGHNLLGMTPMELSIDLGRNNITFLLLSLRGTDVSPDTGQPQKGATKTAEATPARKPERRAERRPAAPVREAAAPAPANPRLFAGDGGQPIPAAGFLGFGSR